MKVRDGVRNIGIIAHVDHGKTTLVDALLKFSGVLETRGGEVQECVMDSNDLERERGITIFSKCASIDYQGVRINIVDTPGHADFGSEVERILSMVDGVLMLVDAAEGPLPQTKFVLRKSLQLGLRPIVVINKIDRPDARPHEVAGLTFDLFHDLEASEEQMDFPLLYASGRAGYAGMSPENPGTTMQPLMDMILKQVPPPVADETQPLQMLITKLDYDDYVGTIAIGRILNGAMDTGKQYAMATPEGVLATGRVTKILGFHGLKRVEVPSAMAGDIVCVAGFEARVGATFTDALNPRPLPAPKIDEPTISMTFGPNTSPLSGQDESQFLTSRQIRERLLHEGAVDVGLRVESLPNSEKMKVRGRGELHLSILIETMRREGYEFEVSRPEVVYRDIDGKKCEPIELLNIDVDTDYQGAVMEELGKRKAELLKMQVSASGKNTMLEYLVPTRSLLGFRSLFLTVTRGTGIMNHVFHEYQPFKGEVPSRKVGVQISMSKGKSVTFALYNLQDRGPLFIPAGVDVYETMIIGINNKGADMPVNPTKTKKLTNMRASGSDEALYLEPCKRLTLEEALAFIEDDELVEITPKNVRIRKKTMGKGFREN